MVRNLSIVAVLSVLVVASPSSSQSPARGLNLTGTVVAVNQQSDSVTLID